MKGMWVAGILFGLLVSCERKKQQADSLPSSGPDKQGIAATGPGSAESESVDTPSGKTSEHYLGDKGTQKNAFPNPCRVLFFRDYFNPRNV
jgi:hypothetical protein